jgi:hydrogenase expression/formation protein HypD
MEVCGTHTMAISRHGLRSLLPENIELLSGPGCPVCVTSAAQVDAFVSLAHNSGVRVMTFGDLYRVPGSFGSLAKAASLGAKVEIIYSPMDALERAKEKPDELVVFLGVGFETTIPAVAATVQAAQQQKVDNFTVFSAHKLMPPALDLLFSDESLNIDGLLCPGHVSVIIGAGAYQNFADKFHLPCAVAGFEPADILYGLVRLVRQNAVGLATVENCYKRVVTMEGNKWAQYMIDKVFMPVDTVWRGLGMIPGSGLAIRPEYAHYDAEKRLDIDVAGIDEPTDCPCGEILNGRKTPVECQFFGRECTPAEPIGPCMVSNEGICAAYFRYGGKRR